MNKTKTNINECPPENQLATILVRSLYRDNIHPNVAPREARRRIQNGTGPTRVNQAFAAECDINNIILRYAGTGQLPTRHNPLTPEFMDVSDVPSGLFEALVQLREAELTFASLPSALREAVDNDPAKLLQALEQNAALRAANPDPAPKDDSQSEKRLDKPAS